MTKGECLNMAIRSFVFNELYPDEGWEGRMYEYLFLWAGWRVYD